MNVPASGGALQAARNTPRMTGFSPSSMYLRPDRAKLYQRTMLFRVFVD
jgi:hypothetical protein